MNKTELISRIAQKTGQTKISIETTLNAMMEVIKQSVHQGEDVTLTGFGTFTVTERKARAGRHPQTGEEMTIPAMKLPRFKPGKEFKGLLQ